MTLAETIRAIEAAAILQPSVNMIVRNDIFRLNSIPNAKYGVFGWTQGQHQIGEDSQIFNFTFFYIDRLTADKANEVEVQSVGIQTIGNILRMLEEAGIPYQEWTAQTFNQRFLDECAGVFTNVRLEVPTATICAETFDDTPAELGDFNNDFNDDFLIDDEEII